MKLKYTLSYIIVIGLLCSIIAFKYQDNNSLHKAYKDFFPIGAAISPQVDLVSTKRMKFIAEQFNSVTAENQMKPKQIHPKEDVYNWAPADAIVRFAKNNKMKVRGHTLVWFQSTPTWMIEDNGKPVSKEMLYEKMKSHITTVMQRYKKDVYNWDVVNEAISNKDNEIFRSNDPLYKIAGEEYVEMAFKFAKEADPNAQLFYNDYRLSNPIKRAKIYNLLKRLKEKGVPIDGLGMQSHYIIGEITEQYLQETIDMFSKLGLKIQVTELDVSVYERKDRTKDDIEKQNLDKADSVYTEQRQKEQLEMYDMLFKVYRANKDIITGVTFWGVKDERENFRTNKIGKMDYPFLFDEHMNFKKAFYKVTTF
jgi:endo-1,4-beta-xylanase